MGNPRPTSIERIHFACSRCGLPLTGVIEHRGRRQKLIYAEFCRGEEKPKPVEACPQCGQLLPQVSAETFKDRVWPGGMAQ